MTLLSTLRALHGNENLNITITDSSDVEKITFLAPGYEAIESDYNSREVLDIKVKSASQVKISIADAQEQPSPDPTPDPTP